MTASMGEMLEGAGGARKGYVANAPIAQSTEPLRLAEALRAYTFELRGVCTLANWARSWWKYDGARYVEYDNTLLDRDIQRFLDVAVVIKKDPDTGVERRDRVTSRLRTISEVRKALETACHLVDGDAPKWLWRQPGDRDATAYVPCRNGLLNLRDGKLLPSTPRLFSVNMLGTEWQPDAPEPTAWLEFLRSQWPDDPSSIRCLQQVFGYLISYDTYLQKLFALVGPTRSGKGTISTVLKSLLGGDAVVSPTLASLERPFGLAPLLGKSVALLADARFGGRDQAQVVERLLSISGEDPLSIDRKNRDPIDVRLHARVLLVSNELPRLYDASGALTSRFVILQTTKSFLGSEDHGLLRRLLAELPGILKWAVDGYHDLQEAGRFVYVASSEAAREQMEAISSPITVFLREVCRIAPELQVEASVIYDKWSGWCKANGREATNAQVFGRDLHSCLPGLRTTRPRRPDGTRSCFYEGVGLA